MNFDCIIMNPPYKRDLHLKILAGALNYLRDETSLCVNLSPMTCLQDPMSKFNKSSSYFRFKNSIIDHIIDLEELERSLMQDLFDNIMTVNLGIYVCQRDEGTNFDNTFIIEHYLGDGLTIFNKVVRDYSLVDDNNNLSKYCVLTLTGICVKINKIYGGERDRNKIITPNHSLPYIDGINENGKSYAECALKKSTVNENKQEQTVIQFEDQSSAKNFIASASTKFMRYINYLTKMGQNARLRSLPWMGEAINPRTKMKGYKSAWTDEDYYNYFNLTKEEQLIIEQTMENYK